jgi:hypothetical protein
VGVMQLRKGRSMGVDRLFQSQAGINTASVAASLTLRVLIGYIWTVRPLV